MKQSIENRNSYQLQEDQVKQQLGIVQLQIMMNQRQQQGLQQQQQ